MGIGNLIGGDDPGTEWAAPIQALGAEELLMLVWQLAGRHIVEYRVAEHIVQGLGLAYIAGRPSHDKGKLDLPVELTGLALMERYDSIRADYRGRCLGEEHGILRQYFRVSPGPRAFKGVSGVVHPQADDIFSGPGNRGQEGHLGEGPRGSRGLHRRARALHARAALFNQALHIGSQVAEIDHAVPLDGANSRV